MIRRYNCLIVIFIFIIPVFLTLPSSESNNQTNQLQDYSIPIYNFPGPINYSFDVNEINNSVNIYTTSFTNLGIYFADTFINSSTAITSKTYHFNISDIPGLNNTFLSGINYFKINNDQLFILSYQIGSKQFVTLYSRNNNSTYSIWGNSFYSIISVRKIAENSPDVYFSVYNSSMFLILKYDYQTKSFSTFFNSPNLYLIRNPEVLYLGNSICVSTSSENLNGSYNSNIFVLNHNGLIFTTNISGVEVTSLASYNNGLILYSRVINTYYEYSFSNNSVSRIYELNQQYNNYTKFISFDNQSYLSLSGDNLVYTKILDNTILNEVSHYLIINSDLNLQAIKLNGNKYIIISGIDGIYNYELDFVLFPNIPLNFIPQSKPTYKNTSYTANYSIEHKFPVSGNNIYDTLEIFILIGLIALIIVMFNKVSSQPSSKNKSNLKNNRIYQETNQTKLLKIYCSHCGEKNGPGEIFCKYCGEKL